MIKSGTLAQTTPVDADEANRNIWGVESKGKLVENKTWGPEGYTPNRRQVQKQTYGHESKSRGCMNQRTTAPAMAD